MGGHQPYLSSRSVTLAVEDVIDALDSFYCHNIVAALWADVAAHSLADRIGDLGGAVTGDPRQLIDRVPGDNEFTIPDCSDPRAISSYALRRLDLIIAAYQAFLDMARGRDEVSFALVIGLLGAEIHRRTDVKAALAGAMSRGMTTQQPWPWPAGSTRARAHAPGGKRNDHRRAGPDQVLRGRRTAL